VIKFAHLILTETQARTQFIQNFLVSYSASHLEYGLFNLFDESIKKLDFIFDI